MTNVTVNTSSAAVYLDGTFAATNFALAIANNTYTATHPPNVAPPAGFAFG